jgi:hypothetical protein
MKGISGSDYVPIALRECLTDDERPVRIGVEAKSRHSLLKAVPFVLAALALILPGAATTAITIDGSWANTWGSAPLLVSPPWRDRRTPKGMRDASSWSGNGSNGARSLVRLPAYWRSRVKVPPRARA